MTKKPKDILSTILNIIKYPFLGLVFIVYYLGDFICHVFKGIAYIVYLISKPFTILYKSLIKKNSEGKTKVKKQHLINENKKDNLKLLQQENEKAEKEKLALEEKERLRKEKAEKRRLALEEKTRLRKEKAEKRKFAFEEKQKLRKEKIEKRKELQEQKRLLKGEKKKKKQEGLQENRKEDTKYQEKLKRQEQKKLAKANKEQKKRELLEKKAQLAIEKERLKEQLTAKKLEEKEERRIEKERVRQAKLEAREQRKDLPLNKRISLIIKSIPTLPALIAKKVSKAFENLPFVRNARNKRDINRQALMLEFEGKDAEKNATKIVYVYEAKNPEGKIVKERFAAYSKVEVHSFLLSEGYEVYSIKTSPLIQLLFKENGTVKFKTKDLVFFLTQLSTYLKAGITLVDALKVLAKQYNKKRTYRDIFRTMIYDLSTGESFSGAMLKQGATFPRLLINMVKAAELTGELTEALDDMAEYYTETEQTKKQMINAMMYPAIVFTVAIAVMTFIMIVVIPNFVELYNSMDPDKIPDFTKAVIRVSDFIKANIIMIVVVIIVIVIAFIILYKKVKSFRTVVQWLLMHVPVIGNVMIYNEVTLFTKTFASLLAHNVYITDSMDILNKITDNEIYKMIIMDTVTNLAKGEKISLAFKDHWAFPIPAYEMLVTGESTGQLAEMMQKVSVYYQEMHRDIVAKIKTFLEPILLIFLTTIVGIIVLAIVIPMFNLYETIQQI